MANLAIPITNAEWSLFLEQLASEPNVSKACRAAGISATAVYSRRSHDVDFRRQWDEALMVGVDRIEEELHRRAVLGVDEPLSFQGRLTGDKVRKFSDPLLALYVKRWKPEYRDRSTVDMNAKIEDHQALTEEQKAELIRQVVAEELAKQQRESDLG